MSAPPESPPTATAARDLLTAHGASVYVVLLAAAGLLVDPEWAEDIRAAERDRHAAEVADLRDQLAGARATVLREAARFAREYRPECQDVAEYEVADELDRMASATAPGVDEVDSAGGAR